MTHRSRFFVFAADAIAPIAGRDAIEVRGEAALGSVIDRAERGQVISIEVLDASEWLPLPLLLEAKFGVTAGHSRYANQSRTR